MAIDKGDFTEELLDGSNDTELLEAVELQYVSSKFQV